MSDRRPMTDAERGAAWFGGPGDAYRYRLTRELRNPPVRWVGFLMLNPSTATADADDPTVRRCIGYAKAWGFDALEVVNLFALRATDPRELFKAFDPIGPDNDREILRAAERCEFLVAAWGAHGRFMDRDRRILELLRGQDVRALRLTKAGAPGHPLYLPKDLEPVPFAPPQPETRGEQDDG